MRVPQKNVNVYFYELSVADQDEGFDQEQFIASAFSNPALFKDGVSITQGVSPSTGHHFELREIEHEGPDIVKGCLAMLRVDAPNVRKTTGREALIPLEEGETLLEKNYFLYYKNKRLLVWQFNLAANHVSNLTQMICSLTGGQKVIGYNYLIKDLFAMQADTEIEYCELRVSLPRKKSEKHEVANLDPTEWGVNPFQIMADSGARQLAITMSNRSEDGLLGSVSKMARDLVGLNVTKTLKVKVDGAKEPIDLLAERFTYKEVVDFVGHYPDPNKIVLALKEAKKKFDAEKDA